jgi:hypothetical protein
MAGINVSDAEPLTWIVSGNALRRLLTEVKAGLDVTDPLHGQLDVALEVGWLDVAQPQSADADRLAGLLYDVSRRLLDDVARDPATDYEAKFGRLLEQLLVLLERRRDGLDGAPSQ